MKHIHAWHYPISPSIAETCPPKLFFGTYGEYSIPQPLLISLLGVASMELAANPRSSVWPDRFGMWASAACVLHCLLTPIVLSISTVAAHFLPSEEKVHRSMALLIAGIGAIALVRGYRFHRRKSVLLLMAAGISLIGFGAFDGEYLPAHWVEVAITFLGSVLMISSHRLNHTFCRDCQRRQ